jgi:AcrR family transcriptional regulator
VKGSEIYQERKREIARVAAEVFNKQGFRGTSLGAVADALNTNRASLYYYIANKRELYDEVVREVSEANVATAQAVHASKASAPEKLRTLIVSLMESYATHYPLLYVYMRSLNRQYEEVFIAIVQAGLDDGSLRSLTTARVTAYGIIGMIGWSNRWFVPQKSEVSGRDIGLAFADMVLGGLVPAKASAAKRVRASAT